MKLNFAPVFYREPATTAALISAGAAILGQGTNMVVQGKLNRKNRKWQDQRYAQQRAHNLADWNMNNEYNSPAAQMRRFKEAGLNPNLIYGKMDNTSSQSVQTAKYEPLPDKAPQVDTSQIQNAGMMYAQARNMAATNKNLEKQNQVLDAEIKAKEAQTLATLAGVDMTKFDLKFKQDLYQTNADMARSTLEKIRADIAQTAANTKFTIDQNERAAALQKPTLEQAIQQVLNMKAGKALTDAQKKKVDQEVKNLVENHSILAEQAKLWKQGINPNHGTFDRMMEFIFNKIFGGNSLSPEQVQKYKDNKINNNPMTGQGNNNIFFK
uniref:DNA pilot protein n=1 Tax=Cressdnaviricota sp. TaxID=2748378 RepID=A0A6M3YRW1_9VIRU|nr:MAG: DNA pilot protein [Cressdnaviricota sp.]